MSDNARRDAVISGLLTAMTHDAQLRAAVSNAIRRPRYAEFAGVIRQAIERGDVAAGCDVALLSRIFPALAFHQVAALAAPLDLTFVEQVVDGVLLPLLTSPGHPDS